MFTPFRKLLQWEIWQEACLESVFQWRNRQEEHQNSMVEIEGMIKVQPISILIDPGARLSYVSPSITESYKLAPYKFENFGRYN